MLISVLFCVRVCVCLVLVVLGSSRKHILFEGLQASLPPKILQWNEGNYPRILKPSFEYEINGLHKEVFTSESTWHFNFLQVAKQNYWDF